MPTEPEPITLTEVVHRAVETCEDGSEALDQLLLAFEDADEPIAAVDDLEGRLDRAVGPRVRDDEPGFTMACAMVLYLAHRRDELDADADELLRLTARAEFHRDPPPPVAVWLQERGVSL